MQSCSGLTVLDLSRGIAGPLAGRLLAECGAAVTRIVRPGGDRLAEHPASLPWRFGKATREIDLASAAGQAELHRLAGTADVLIESFRPGRMESWGLGYADLVARNPRLVYCAITGYGPDGPRSGEPAYEALVQAVSGVMGGQPGFRPGPVPVAVPLASVEAGLLAAAGVLAALLARERGLGRGQRVDTSLLAGSMFMQLAALLTSERIPDPKYALDPLGATPGFKLYPCADGQWIHVACLHPDFFQRLLVAMDLAEVLLDPRFDQAPNRYKEDADRRALIAILEARFRERPAADWLRLFEEADVPCAPVRAAEDLWREPQAAHQRILVEEDDPTLGRVRRVGRLLAERAGVEPAPPLPPLAAGAPPLAGLRVLDAGAYQAGPQGCRLLADLGADVVKLEPLEGDPFRTTGNVFLALNHGKRSLAVDLKSEPGRAILEKLAGTCHAVLHNLRPGAAEPIGLGYSALAARAPGLVYSHVTAFGADGPAAHRPGYDPLGQALAGVEHAQGGRGNPPSNLRTAVCDVSAGTLAAVSVLAGLLGRQRHGRGAHFETSLLRVGAALTAERSFWYEGRPPLRQLDRGQYGTSLFHRLYRTADGWLFLVAPPDRRAALAEALGVDRLEFAVRGSMVHPGPAPAGATGTDLTPHFGLRTSNWEASAIAATLAHLPTHDALARLREAGVPAAPVAMDYPFTFTEDPQPRSQGLAAVVQHPGYGALRFVGPPLRLSTSPPRLGHRPAPTLGEQSEEILAELGYEAEARAALRARNVVSWGHNWPDM